MRFIAIDSETTGLDPNKCQMWELGMIHADLRMVGTKVTCDIDVKHWYIKPRNGSHYVGENYALNMNKDAIAMVVAGEVESHKEEAVTDQIAQWMRDLGYTKTGFVPCGKNVMGFDMRFLRRLPGWGYPAIKHKHRAIDVGTLMLRPDDECPPDLAECKRRAGLPDTVSHLAVDDALDCVNIVKWWFERRGYIC